MITFVKRLIYSNLNELKFVDVTIEVLLERNYASLSCVSSSCTLLFLY